MDVPEPLEECSLIQPAGPEGKEEASVNQTKQIERKTQLTQRDKKKLKKEKHNSLIIRLDQVNSKVKMTTTYDLFKPRKSTHCQVGGNKRVVQDLEEMQTTGEVESTEKTQ